MALLRSVAGSVVGTALLVLISATLEAQEQLRIAGSVQWVAGTRMQMMTTTGSSIAVDLMQVDQSSYRTLRANEWVIVDGVVASDRRRIIAYNIWRDRGASWAQSP